MDVTQEYTTLVAYGENGAGGLLVYVFGSGIKGKNLQTLNPALRLLKKCIQTQQIG